MRNKILLYLFIFAVLFTMFIYVNDKKILDARDEEIVELREEIGDLKAELKDTNETNDDLESFSLMGNEEAMTYFENRGFEAKEVLLKVQDELISRNKASEDNELVPFDGMNGPMRINKIKVLNHKWIIANFTDGKYWGEVFLTYELDDDGNFSFTPEKSFLYSGS